MAQDVSPARKTQGLRRAPLMHDCPRRTRACRLIEPPGARSLFPVLHFAAMKRRACGLAVTLVLASGAHASAAGVIDRVGWLQAVDRRERREGN